MSDAAGGRDPDAVDPGTGDDRKRELVTLVLLACLAALVRLPGLGFELWIDEIATVVGLVRLPLGELLSSYPSPNHHILNSALAHLSVGVFGETAWAVRLPAYLFGVATVPALYLLARETLSRGEAVGASVVLALSYHHAYFSQNARGYTGYVFFTVLGTYFLIRALKEGDRRDWIGFALAGALNVYVLLSGLFAVVAQFLGALLLRVAPVAREVRVRRLRDLLAWTGVAAVITLLLYLPLMGELVRFYTTAEGEVGWRLSEDLLGAILEAAAVPMGRPWIVAAAGVMGLPVVVVGVRRLGRRIPLAFFAFLLPPVLELTVAGLLGAGSFPRRFILLVPFGALLGVSGVRGLAGLAARLLQRERVQGPLFAAGVLAGCLVVASPLPTLYSTPKQDFRGALEWVEGRVGEDEIVVAAWVAAPPARYHGADVRTARTREDLEAILAEGRPTWLLTTFQRDMERFEPELADLVQRRFDLRERFPGLVGGGAVLVWERRSGSDDL